MLRILGIIGLLSTAVFAKEVKPIKGKSHDCHVYTDNKQTTLNCKSIDFKLEKEVLDNHFKRWIILESKKFHYITLFFSKGMHGEKAIIFSLKTKQKLQEITSAWPIEISKKENVIRLHYKDGDQDKLYKLL